MLQVNAILLLAMLLDAGFSGIPPRQVVVSHATLPQAERTHQESNFYYDGKKWNRNWFQCDGTREVTIMITPQETMTHSLLKFSTASPSAKQIFSLARVEEPDCAMMKCWWHFKVGAPAQQFLTIQESRYYEPADGFWTSQYKLGFSSDPDSTRADLNCRWFPRTRVAVITARSSLYITETKTGRLTLRAFDYGRTRRSLTLNNGVTRIERAGQVESFSFRSRSTGYVIKVSRDESNPGIEVSHTTNKRAVVENPLSYTYVTKQK